MPDSSSASQAINVVSDDDEDDQKENTPHSSSPYYIRNNSTPHFFMMENDATLTGLIVEVTDKYQNIKLPALKQSNVERVFFEVLNSER